MKTCALPKIGITVLAAALVCFAQGVPQANPRIPDEVRYKAGYVNSAGRPDGFKAVMLWGIAIADTRVPGYEDATVEIAATRLSCRVNGKDAVLNDDVGVVRGGLYRRNPWFGTEVHESIPTATDSGVVVLRVGTRPDKVWHFWSGSSRKEIPTGKFDGCTVRAKVRISPGALLQVGMDYWKDARIDYGAGGNNKEAGVSHWYFPSPEWQEAEFTDIHPSQPSSNCQ